MNNTDLKQLLMDVLDSQEALNCAIDPDWRAKRYPWRRAIWVECAELLESFPWKWWVKEGHPDLDNITIELVDIFHFLLSYYLELIPNKEKLAEMLVAKWELATQECPIHRDQETILQAIELLALESLTNVGSMLFFRFGMLCYLCGVDLPRLSRVYFGKNALNEVRAILRNSYSRDWNGVEDNKVMLKALNNFPNTQGKELQTLMVEYLLAIYPQQ